MKVYAIFATKNNKKTGERAGDLIWAWALTRGREWVAGEVIECELTRPEPVKTELEIGLDSLSKRIHEKSA